MKRKLARLVGLRKGNFAIITKDPNEIEKNNDKALKLYIKTLEAINSQSDKKGLSMPLTYKDKYLIYF